MNNSKFTRRHLLQSATLVMVGGSTAVTALARDWQASQPIVKAGLLTDVHYADADPRGTRIYRDSLAKMRLATAEFRKQKVDFAVETGDFVDAPANTTPEIELGFLRTIDAEFRRCGAPTHYVLGNHCVNAMSKEQFLGQVKSKRSYYSWDQGGWHWVVLDACNRKDGVSYVPGNFQWTDTEIPGPQQEWLKADLEKTNLPTVIFVHQRLDLPQGDNYAIWSSEAIRAIIKKSGKVTAVIMGHSHKNYHVEIEGVHYVVTAATVEGAGVENAGYSVLKGYDKGILALEGFVTHKSNPFRRSDQ